MVGPMPHASRESSNTRPLFIARALFKRCAVLAKSRLMLPEPYRSASLLPIARTEPSSSAIKLMPPASKARVIASRLFVIGTLRPFSKSRTVLSETLARLASSSWLQSSQPRAARLCSGFNMTQNYPAQRLLSKPTKRVDVGRFNEYPSGE